jgi:hypothetical protein
MHARGAGAVLTQCQRSATQSDWSVLPPVWSVLLGYRYLVPVPELAGTTRANSELA